MRRLGLLNTLLLGTLLPIWLVCFGLHVAQLRHTGLAVPPIFAIPGQPRDEYPRVGGLRPETLISEPGLEVGDRLLRVGSADLRGVGYIGFYAAVLSEAGDNDSAPVEFERAGQRAVIDLPLSRAPIPWFRIPALLAIVATAVLVLVRAAPSRHVRLFFAAFMSLLILETPFDGGPPLQTAASQLVFFFAGGIAVSLMLRWAILFPEEVPPAKRIALGWAWVAGMLWYAMHSNFLFGGPLPSPRLPAIALGLDALIGLAFLGALTWNYRHASPIGRRRVKWILLGAYVGTLTLLSTVVLNYVDPDSPWLDEMLMLSTLALPVMAVAFLIGIIRYNLFDIDRLISATTAYSVVLVVLLALGIVAAPRIATPIGALLGMQEWVVQIVLSLGLAGLLIPAQRAVRGWIDHLFFKDRVRFQEGVAVLLRDLSARVAPRELLARTGEALDDFLHPTVCVVYGRDAQEYAPAFARGQHVVPSFEAASALVAALAQQSGPVARERSTEHRRSGAPSAFDRAALDTLAADVIVPVVQPQRGLAAFICMGAKRSGDVYTSTDLTLLAVIADKLATVLHRPDEPPFPLPGDGARRSGEWEHGLAGKNRLEDVVEFAIAQCRDALAAESAAVLLLDADSHLLYLPYVAEHDAEVAGRLRAVRFPADRGIAGAVLQSREPARVDDVAGDARFFSGVDQHSGRPTVSLLCVPLVVGAHTIGVIEVVNAVDRPAFDDRDLALLVALAGRIATAIAELEGQHREATAAAATPTIPATPLVASAAPTARNELRREGDYWSVSYEGTTLRLKDMKGLHYLAHLLRHPGQEVHAMDLLTTGTGGQGTAVTDQRYEVSDDREPTLDAQAKAQYRSRLEDLRAELEEAERNSDLGRAEKAREEMDFIANQLAAAVGLGGRDRPTGANAERARLTVTKGIKAVLEKIRASHPGLARHLATSIKTGYFCSYSPDPQDNSLSA